MSDDQEHPDGCKCVMCADPGYDMQAQINKAVSGPEGRQVIGVFPDQEVMQRAAAKNDPAIVTNSAFAYTVGNAVKGFPELIVIGMYDDTSMIMLNALSNIMIKRGHAFSNDEVVKLNGEYGVKVIATDPAIKEDHTCIATKFFGDQSTYEVMQVIVPDKKGVFPEDERCDAPWSFVRVWRHPDDKRSG